MSRLSDAERFAARQTASAARVARSGKPAAPRIEIIHQRDPDAECCLSVHVDGVHVENVAEYDVDPGAGYTRSDWDETTEALCAGASPEVAALLRELRDTAADESKYVEDDR